jgi:hypothetical protein
MKFYTKQHKYYCGIDLHTKKMYVCILDAEGQIRLHQNIKTDPQHFIRIRGRNRGTSYIVPVKRENEKMLSFVKTIS